ncbi:type IV secretion system protein VirD4 [Candidatus Xenohaliotis californiensis]|uniref:Type IV secretion system protein VirD4 n=3 Tax=Candidatus Xenohaliotis californiensis TaxID=84677 RepID=A0ABP0ERU2_9RICK|nr:type IV secretion system protein VirD4 [Candidatus Xenohaliotis californiensis]
MRNIRNIIVFLLIGFVLIEICFYFSAVIFILLQWGPAKLNFSAIRPNLHNFPANLVPTMLNYIAHWLKYGKQYSDSTRTNMLIALIAPFVFTLVFLWAFKAKIMSWRPFKKKEALHGDAKWAGERAIVKAGLRSKKGILLGKDSHGYLIADGFQHALLFAPTGSGKGVGFVIPNLLFWNDSVFVHDIKLENYELTSGWRKSQGHAVYCWNPADPEGMSHCYNPIDWVSSKPGQMVDDVQKIANLLMPEQDFWVNEARSLFLGVVLYLLAVPDKIKSFGEVVRTMRSDDVTYNLAVVLDTIGKKIHPVAYMNIAAFLQKADKERSGVVSTMNSSLELWANPLIDTTTATSDFNIMEFKKKKTTVYVGLTPDNLSRLRPLMQVFYQQATEFLCRRLPTKDDVYGVLFMMDEFPTLGKMEQFKTGIAYFRGYRVRLFLIIQDTEQLKGIYEESGMNSFLSNSTYRITFAANNVETANLISQLVGNKTVEQESVNRPKYLDLNPASRSVHVSEAQRALLLPQEVIMLPRDEQILLIESTSPIKSKKIIYYKEHFFKKKLMKPTFVPAQEPYELNSNDEDSDSDSDSTDAPSALPPGSDSSTSSNNENNSDSTEVADTDEEDHYEFGNNDTQDAIYQDSGKQDSDQEVDEHTEEQKEEKHKHKKKHKHHKKHHHDGE